MMFLYPSLLWMFLPLGLLLWKSPKSATIRIHLIVLILLVFALARPVEKQVLQEASIEAKDIIIALDVSYSMQATDLLPTRYDFAKETIRTLLEKNPSSNIMLIAFTSNPLLLSPPTTDHRLIEVALQSLNPKYILTKGTSLKALFKKLSSMDITNKHLIVLSDGGERGEVSKDFEEFKKLLLDTGAYVHILALGTTQGTTILGKDGVSLKDKQGNLVISRINPLLDKLARSVNGTYMTANATPQATASTLSKLLVDTNNKTQHIKKMQFHYKEWYPIPLTLALLLFLLVHTRGVRYLLLLFALLGLPLHASIQASFFDLYHLQQAYACYANKTYACVQKNLKQIHAPSLQSRLLLANTYYKQENYKQAILTYRSIRTSSVSKKQLLYYNIATAYAQMQAYDKAKIYYTKALQLQPDEDTEFNLALIALKHDKKEASLGIAHPKSQSTDSSKSESQEKQKENAREEDQPSSGSGGGGESTTKEKQKESKLRSDESQDDTPHPLGSKVYELINKGYIRETQPW